MRGRGKGWSVNSGAACEGQTSNGMIDYMMLAGGLTGDGQEKTVSMQDAWAIYTYINNVCICIYMYMYMYMRNDKMNVKCGSL